MGTIIGLAILVIMLAGVWKVLEKAGQPGWGAIIPIYNLYLLIKAANRPGWYLILFLIPIVSVIMFFVVYMALAKSFGKGILFGVGLVVLPFIFFPILGFSEDQYLGEVVEES